MKLSVQRVHQVASSSFEYEGMVISAPLRFGLALLGLLGVMALVTWSHNGRVQVYGGILGVLFVLPLNILLYRDMARSLAHRGSPGRTFGLLLPIRLFVLVSLVGGLTLLAWVGYRLVIKGSDQFPEMAVRFYQSLGLIGLGQLCIKYPVGRPKDDEDT